MTKLNPLLILAILAAAPAWAEQPPGPILPEVTTAVDLSSTDVNRIVCPGTINDLIFSKEKGVEGHFTGNNAFVKFSILVEADAGKQYSTTPSELFVNCSGAIYSLIGTPKRIPSVTVRLSPPAATDLKQNIDRYQALPFEKKVLQLIREAYLGEYPESYRVKVADAEVAVSADLTVRLTKTLEVEGAGLRLKEYLARPAAGRSVRITERDFLRPGMGERIVAVVVENQGLEPGQSSRVFIVEQRGGEL
jgi:conjugal transfer pilus assembly protein TraK